MVRAARKEESSAATESGKCHQDSSPLLALDQGTTTVVVPSLNPRQTSAVAVGPSPTVSTSPETIGPRLPRAAVRASRLLGTTSLRCGASSGGVKPFSRTLPMRATSSSNTGPHLGARSTKPGSRVGSTNARCWSPSTPPLAPSPAGHRTSEMEPRHLRSCGLFLGWRIPLRPRGPRGTTAVAPLDASSRRSRSAQCFAAEASPLASKGGLHRMAFVQ
jgi:hypothetical protein